MGKNISNLSRTDKILITIYKLSNKKNKNILFEDIVVQLFKDFNEDFHLRGYKQYPDSENVNKAIYSNLRREGYITYGNKIFELTSRGIRFAENIINEINDKKIVSKKKYTNFLTNELKRVLNLQGYKLFINGNMNNIVDTDFYNYIGVSVKTPKDQILGRLNIMNDFCKEIKETQNTDYYGILKYHDFLNDKFVDLINYYTYK